VSINPYDSPVSSRQRAGRRRGRPAEYVSARFRTWLASGFLGITAFLALVKLASDIGALASLGSSTQEPIPDSIVLRTAVLNLASFLVFFPTSAFFLAWFYRAYRNLAALDAKRLQYSPASAVWWWFVPFANLWMPYDAASEIWSFSRPLGTRNRSALVGWWWAAWIAHNVCDSLSSVVFRRFSAATLNANWFLPLGSDVLTLTASVLAICVVHGVYLRQEARHAQMIMSANAAALSAEPAAEPSAPASGQPEGTDF
jgi:hypothetical protein